MALVFVGGAFGIASCLAMVLRGGDAELYLPERNLVFGALFGGAALGFAPSMRYAAAGSIVAGIASAIWPASALILTNVTMLLGIGTMIWESLHGRPS